ncbi:demethylmenaquinone methyltransferase [Arachnia propionica]|uniref:Demethylmenaquinone methyltransferase n=1 Tax=Arachnia propionica TaxID=1750 RepID=A0A3P1T4S3_9ACTN|nr:demethylmenaquinone methyltransferase [Arachnia propionica]MDO5083315.1 demethylmenaquinone methyltransferase [Arachnia propionica]RRD03806.1 demethylmenaquinone methyltransferase [Arachnia propionica]
MERTRADLDKISAEVQAMFDGVAERYDLLNAVLSLGQEKRWRRHTLAALHPRPGERVLDLAAGTGTSSVPYQLAGATVFPTDYSMGMLQVGKRRQPGLNFVRGDALALPYADDSFDAVTISYGLRNVEDTAGALREMLRVTRPGGRLVIAEFSTPVHPWFRFAYVHGALRMVPVAAKLSSNPVAYGYLAESILAWPNQRALADLIAECGWREVEFKNLTGGIVALHRARK